MHVLRRAFENRRAVWKSRAAGTNLVMRWQKGFGIALVLFLSLMWAALRWSLSLRHQTWQKDGAPLSVHGVCPGQSRDALERLGWRQSGRSRWQDYRRFSLPTGQELELKFDKEARVEALVGLGDLVQGSVVLVPYRAERTTVFSAFENTKFSVNGDLITIPEAKTTISLYDDSSKNFFWYRVHRLPHPRGVSPDAKCFSVFLGELPVEVRPLRRWQGRE